MDTDGIVPSILTEVPPSTITITYPNSRSVDLGTKLSTHEVKNAPEVKWEANPEKYYTLYMFDPDAPSRSCNFLSDIIHWLVANIKGCDLGTGTVVAKYEGAGPPPGGGVHRYIFVLFEHDELITFEKVPMGRLQRVRFSMKKFEEKFKLNRIVGWNYFNAEWSRKPKKEESIDNVQSPL